MDSNQRRSFLKQVGGLAAAAAAPPLASAATAGPQPPPSAALAGAIRPAAAGRFAIDLDGIFGGFLYSVEGGHATADVVVEELGPDNVQRKHLGNVKYEDISFQCGAAMSKDFFEWIRSSFDHKVSPRDGSIITTDANLREISRLSFRDALITEIGFPALDASSKDVAKFTVKLSAESTQLTFGKGPALSGAVAKQKAWLTSNFKITIDGLDTSRVNAVESLVVRRVVVQNQGGGDFQEPAESYLEVPNLVITFPESRASDFYKWHEDFVIKGNNGQEEERFGTLNFLSPNLKDSLFTLGFGHLGIFKLGEAPGNGPDQVRRLRAEMYCEEMKFDG